MAALVRIAAMTAIVIVNVAANRVVFVAAIVVTKSITVPRVAAHCAALR